MGIAKQAGVIKMFTNVKDRARVSKAVAKDTITTQQKEQEQIQTPANDPSPDQNMMNEPNESDEDDAISTSTMFNYQGSIITSKTHEDYQKEEKNNKQSQPYKRQCLENQIDQG